MCKCKSCPMEITSEEGAMADAYGCLPTLSEVFKWYEDTGKVWACHNNPTKACQGFINVAKTKGIEVKGTELITEETTLEQIYEQKSL